MVYLTFPSELTEEEVMLQNKYAKLRKKKKALQLMKAPRQEPPPVNPVKRPFEAKNAKELAKKLIRSGAIRSIEKRDEVKDKKIFKRSKGLEKKLSGSDRAVRSYQPFSAVHTPEPVSSAASAAEHDKIRPGAKSKGLYDSYASSARDKQERWQMRDSAADCSSSSSPSSAAGAAAAGGSGGSGGGGHTIYVNGLGITEQLIKQAFVPFGNIVHVSMEIEKNCGFVTFDRAESAERAVRQMNGASVQHVPLQVSFARRQPKVEPINDAATSSAWSTIAASHSQKGMSRTASRDLVIYDDVFS